MRNQFFKSGRRKRTAADSNFCCNSKKDFLLILIIFLQCTMKVYIVLNQVINEKVENFLVFLLRSTYSGTKQLGGRRKTEGGKIMKLITGGKRHAERFKCKRKKIGRRSKRNAAENYRRKNKNDSSAHHCLASIPMPTVPSLTK